MNYIHITPDNITNTIQYRSTQLASKQITHTGPEIWHNLPQNFELSKNVKILKKTYKKILGKKLEKNKN
jgi:hypothetical protein